MKLGMFGLGRMGANMALRLIRSGHEVVGWSRSVGTVAEARKLGVPGSTSMAEIIAALESPRIAWLMIPAGAPVDATIADHGAPA